MADKKESALGAVTDFAQARVLDASGASKNISKADMASVLAGQMKIKYGSLRTGTTTLTLGSGFFFYTVGGSHSGLYHLDYWTPEITLIGGGSIGGLGSIVQSANSKYDFVFTLNDGILLNYVFIGGV